MPTISIQLEMPDPETSVPEAPAESQSVEERIQEAIDCIRTGEDTAMHWALLNRMFRTLSSIPRPSARAKNILSMIRPVLAKYGYHGVASNRSEV